MSLFQAIDHHISAHLGEYVEELRVACSIPSVSARGEGVVECAELVASMLSKRRLTIEVGATGGAPIVFARATGGPGSRRLLFYNHYDVQPVDPIEQWTTPPFDLTERDGALFARGAKDDKGELVCRLAAVDAVLAVLGSLPCAVTWLVEGEEEVGSPHLPEWVEAHRQQLGADAAIWEEGGVDADGAPIVRLGTRGLLYVELAVVALAHDAHSGQANLLPNAAWRLTWALASLKDQDEHVAIPGFYDNVRPPNARQLELLNLWPGSAEDLKTEFGVDRLLGDVSDLNRHYFNPTCNIAGITAGYQGEGSKTVIPASAMAKIDFRLVPNQSPEEIVEKLSSHLRTIGIGEIDLRVLGAERPSTVDPESRIVRLAGSTATEVYGKPPRMLPMSSGTTPMYLFTETGVPVVCPGVGWGAKNRTHSPNEFIRLEDFERAARHIARLIVRFAGDET